MTCRHDSLIYLLIIIWNSAKQFSLDYRGKHAKMLKKKDDLADSQSTCEITQCEGFSV